MRINGPNGTALANTPTGARRTAAPGGFSVSEGDTARKPAATSTLHSVSGIDALMALQGIGDATERRKRAVKQGRQALDMLDTLKIGLLEGDVDPSTLGRLKAAAAGLKEGSGDSGLDAVLGEIELRVEVELAKAGVR
jgi:class II flagellar assembly regulator FliX